MLALSRCSATLSWRLPLRCSALCLASRSVTAAPQFLKSQTAQFHQSKARAMSSLEGGLIEMGMWSLGIGAVGAALAGIFLANTDMCLPKGANASLEHLEDADLRSTTDDGKVIKAKSLWEKNGAVIMAEASELSSLKPQLEELGVPLVAVVKENVGSEIQDFRPHFAGDIYVDEMRKMGGLGFIRLGVWQNFIRAWRSGYQGNMHGEGFILGGVFVIGPGDQGILLEHKEKQFGDKVDTADVLKAVRKIVP
ncbi:hypothetical protein CCH79_00001672, partial [Gambusia affinis]